MILIKPEKCQLTLPWEKGGVMGSSLMFWSCPLGKPELNYRGLCVVQGKEATEIQFDLQWERRILSGVSKPTSGRGVWKWNLREKVSKIMKKKYGRECPQESRSPYHWPKKDPEQTELAWWNKAGMKLTGKITHPSTMTSPAGLHGSIQSTGDNKW